MLAKRQQIPWGKRRNIDKLSRTPFEILKEHTLSSQVVSRRVAPNLWHKQMLVPIGNAAK
jgi:hypothetical protein